MTPIKKVENISKSYRIGKKETYGSLRDEIMQTLTAPLKYFKKNTSMPVSDIEDTVIWALKDVSFNVEEGEIVGIIGRNGAGKSTLLKILSKITEPTAGSITMRGRVASLLEVGTGFHPELTGRENILLNGALLGMRRREINRKFDEIVDFAEIDKFLDTPVKRYSSGMYVRLAFAVAAHLEPEILIVDEVLAVGDVQFQNKCLGKMGDVAKRGRTVLFVSHNLAAVESLCKTGIVLNQGQTQYIGNQNDAIAFYLKSFNKSSSSIRGRLDRKGTGELRVVDIEIKDGKGSSLDTVVCGQDIYIYFYFETIGELKYKHVVASLAVKTMLGVPIFLHHNRLMQYDFGKIPKLGAFVFHIPKLPLPESTYRLDFSIFGDSVCMDSLSCATEINVVEGKFFKSSEVPPVSHGVCLIEGEWSLKPSAEPEKISV